MHAFLQYLRNCTDVTINLLPDFFLKRRRGSIDFERKPFKTLWSGNKPRSKVKVSAKTKKTSFSSTDHLDAAAEGS